MKSRRHFRVEPAHEDPENSVDLFDAKRRNENGELFCVAAAILPSQIEKEWSNYVQAVYERSDEDLP